MTRSISGSSATSTTAGRAAHELELDTEQARGLAEAVPAAIEEHPQGKEKLSGQLEGAKASQASRDAVRTSEKTLPIDDPEKNAGKGHGDDGTILVDWDGPDDPENPLNWSNKQKWLATTIISLFTFSVRSAHQISRPSKQTATDARTGSIVNPPVPIRVDFHICAFAATESAVWHHQHSRTRDVHISLP